MAKVPDWILNSTVAILDAVLPCFRRPPGAAADQQIEAAWRQVHARMAGDVRAAARAATLADDLAEIIDGYHRAAADPRQAIAGLQKVVRELRAYHVGDATSSASSQQQRINELALLTMIECLALAAMARALVRVELASHGEAKKLREQFVRDFDTAIDRASDAGWISTIRELRGLLAIVVRDLTERGRPLARVVTYATPMNMPAVVLAHALYYDAGREGEVINQNDPPHPTFMPITGQALSE